MEIDKDNGVLFVLLDLTAVLDTFDHKHLLNSWSIINGIKVMESNWFQSYLSDKTQAFTIGSH